MIRLNKIMVYSFFCSCLLMLSHSVFSIDTLNYVDENNLKQGYWVYTNKSKKLPNYRDNQVVEEGYYKDDKKSGKWTFYYNNDKVKQILTYTNNRPDGYSVFYYKNGNKREEGIWKGNKWVGNYTYYHESGKIKNDWNYNENGQRTGIQKYYYENGQLMVEGEWMNGKESGIITEYYLDGSVKSERKFENGSIDLTQVKKYEPQEKEGKVTVEKVLKKPEKDLDQEKNIIVKKAVEKKDASPWSGNGNRKFYNKRGQVVREGYFENGFLLNGSVYTYTSKGKKDQTTIYKGGIIVKEIKNENSKEKK